MGAFGTVDNRFLFTGLRWVENQPARGYRNYEIGLSAENGWSYDWLRRNRSAEIFGNITLPNFWEASIGHWRSVASLSDRLTRGGPVMGTPAAWGAFFDIENSDGARTQWAFEIGGDRSEDGSWESGVEAELSFRPGDRWEVSLVPEYGRARDMRQYLMTVPVASSPTYNNRYVFGAVDQSEVSAQLRLNYTFTPNLTLETYAEPFASSGRFHTFGQLSAPRARSLDLYGAAPGSTVTRNPDGSHDVTDAQGSFTIDNEDFNVRSFRSNAVLRWEWRAGSTLFLVWQQNREADRAFGVARPGDLFDTLNAPGENFLAIKLTYWTALR
jgi:hypothetical protein